ncbi:MAG TPA: plastocyanin/azurin family copper-binding protein [Acidimicrobiales bacterium]
MARVEPVRAVVALGLVVSAAAAGQGCGSSSPGSSSNRTAGSGPPAASGRGTPPTDAPGTDDGTVAATVEVKDVAYKPSRVAVTTGQSVTWRFADGDIPHNVNFTTFRSGDPTTTGTYTHTFTTAGRYSYLCDVHPSMVGEVDVTG